MHEHNVAPAFKSLPACTTSSDCSTPNFIIHPIDKFRVALLPPSAELNVQPPLYFATFFTLHVSSQVLIHQHWNIMPIELPRSIV
jgi:hypothetical protein